MTIEAMRLLPAAASLMLVFAVPARAAGGHFDVDDATVLDPGRCQVEAWVARAPKADATIAHLGPGCRLGPVEVGVNLDRVSVSGNGRTLLGPQLKWVVDPLVDKLSAGIAWSAGYDLTNRGRPTQTLYVPVTWWAADKFWVHANLGLDRNAQGERWRRQGLSGEWAASDQFTVIAERVKFVGDWTSRLGGRVNVNEMLSVDLSAARVGPRAERVYVIGLNREFAR
jgi:hypothetical protein